MMNWDYRVAKFTTDTDTLYAIVEAYYTGEDMETPTAITGEPFFPAAISMEELAKDLKTMVEALGKPVIDAGQMNVAMETHGTQQ